MRTTVTGIVQDLRRRLEGLYGDRLAKVLIYGSQARGDSEAGSDIDVLVVLKGAVHAGEEVDRTLDIVAELSFNTDELINCVFVSDREFAEHDSPLLLNARREGVVV